MLPEIDVKMTLPRSPNDPRLPPFSFEREVDERGKNGREKSGEGRTRRREDAGEAREVQEHSDK